MALCNYIIAYCELQGVSFQKLVLPHDDIVQSLYTFLKGGSIPEALLSNANPNNWGNSLVQEILHCHCYKVSVGRMKECNRCHNWFHEVCEDFHCEDQIKFSQKTKFKVKTNGFAATA